MAKRNETTSKRVASTASKLLKNSSSKKVRSVSGSALTQKARSKK